MKVQAIRENEAPARAKSVEANQKAIDSLPLNSGTWSVDGVPGLYLRCRAKTKSFFLQRRVDGYLVKQNLGALPMKRARAAAMKTWSGMKVSTQAADGAVTLGAAIEQYIEAKALAAKTRHIARYNTERYLSQMEGAHARRHRPGSRRRPPTPTAHHQ
jgi:hypothetical protein